MRKLIMIAAATVVLLVPVAAQAQSDREGSTEAGTSYRSHGGYYGGAYARFGGHYYGHRHYR
jgi:hypothetical protein